MKNEAYDLQILSFSGIKYKQTYNCNITELYFSLPELPKILICCDGASKGNPGEAGYGFVARNGGTGEFLIAVAGGLGVATYYFAELMAVICAGEWALQNGHREVVFQSDSKSAILGFQNNNLSWFISARWNIIIDSIRSIEFAHSYREINFSVDQMEKEGSGLNMGIVKIYTNSSSIILESPFQAYYRFK
ncbi:uncharacterized protein LOC113356302 [Papaver somniferum]|uniref:uncharacterized protein LOC113356302 n=1 Tax=Papaver somniferum TaxID=3469 RepID=UPI000E704C3D|nr:uncharacterized protein LOC113356302 [Papaver somniferum]